MISGKPSEGRLVVYKLVMRVLCRFDLIKRLQHILSTTVETARSSDQATQWPGFEAGR